MDKVKKYWKKVVEERDQFWSSFFKKYEENKQDVDVRSYIDKSSSRIESLLQIANDEEEECEVSHVKVQRYFEEQCNDSSKPAVEVVNTTPVNNDEQEEEDASFNLGPSACENQVSSVFKMPEPTFIVEILPEDDVNEKPQITHFVKKLKLFDSQTPVKQKADETVADDEINSSSDTLNDSNSSNFPSCNNDSFRYVCRRKKSRSKYGSAPKRFKLV